MQNLRKKWQGKQSKKIGALLVAVLLCFFSILHLLPGNIYSKYAKIDPLIDITLHQERSFMIDFYGDAVLEGADIDQIEEIQEHFRTWMASQFIEYTEKQALTHARNSMILSLRSSDIPRLARAPHIQSVFPLKGSFSPARGIAVRHIASPKERQQESFTGKGVRVGIIDTGIQTEHPELKGRVVGGTNFANPARSYDDQGYHGTFVAGVIGGAGWDGFHQGVAPEVEFISYVVFEYGRAMSVSIFPALEQAIKDECDIVVLSLNGLVGFDPSREHDALIDTLSLVRRSGIAVIAAAGNEGQPRRNVDRIRLPGASSDVLTVGASNDRRTQWIELEDDQGHRQSIGATLGMPSKPFDTSLSELPVMSASYGRREDFVSPGPSAENGDPFIALVHRGPVDNPISFHEKMKNAMNAGAKAVIFVNYPGADYVNPRVDTEIYDRDWHKNTIPSCIVQYEDIKFALDHLQDWTFYFSTRYPSIPDIWTSAGPIRQAMIKPDLIAPGLHIFSIVGLGYQWASGSSISAGFVAGAAACLMEAHPDWSVDQVFSALMHTATWLVNPLTDQPFSWFLQGAGEVNLNRALQAPAHIYPLSMHVQSRGQNVQQSILISNTQQRMVSKEVSAHMINKLPFKASPIEVIPSVNRVELPSGGSVEIEIQFKVDVEKIENQYYEGWVEVGDLKVPFVIDFPGYQVSYAPVQYVEVSPERWDIPTLFDDGPIEISFLISSGSRIATERAEFIRNNAIVDISVIDRQGLEWGQIFAHNGLFPDYYQMNFNELFMDRTLTPPDGEYFVVVRMWGIDRNLSVIQSRETFPIEIVNSPNKPVNVHWHAYRKHLVNQRFNIELKADRDLNISHFIMECRFQPGQLTCQSIHTRAMNRWIGGSMELNRIGSNAKGIMYASWSTPDQEAIFIPKGTSLLEMGFEGIFRGESSIRVSKLYAFDESGELLTFRSPGFTCFLYDRYFLRGDVNNDGEVDEDDWAMMKKAFGSTYGDENFDLRCDINGDGIVDIKDLYYLSREYLP